MSMADSPAIAKVIQRKQYSESRDSAGIVWMNVIVVADCKAAM